MGTFTQSVFAQAQGGYIDFKEDLRRGINDFPIKSIFNIAETNTTYSTKEINGANYNVKKTKTENGIIYYVAAIIGETGNYFINVNEKTRQIVSLEYVLFNVKYINGYDYYAELMPEITSTYGAPTKEEYDKFQNKDYKYAQFYEKDKYEYYLGLCPDRAEPSRTDYKRIHFIVRAL